MKDEHGSSNRHAQSSGIAQGCPLSPHLFIIMLSVLMGDVEQDVISQFGCAQADVLCSDVAYADDTALVSNDMDRLQFFLDRLIFRARMYGLEPNWDKTVHLRIRHDMDIRTPQGMPLKTVTSAVYLGSLLRADGKTGASVARRVGEARASFDALQAVWRHANIRKGKNRSTCLSMRSTNTYVHLRNAVSAYGRPNPYRCFSSGVSA